MQQDFRQGRARTEIDEINGAVVHAGTGLGVSTPANEQLCAMVREAISAQRSTA